MFVILIYFILLYCKYFLYADIPYTGNCEIYYYRSGDSTAVTKRCNICGQ